MSELPYRTDTLRPEAVSDELAPTIAELGLEENCRQLVDEGYTVIENAASPEFNERFRDTIIRTARRIGDRPAAGGKSRRHLRPGWQSFCTIPAPGLIGNHGGIR